MTDSDNDFAQQLQATFRVEAEEHLQLIIATLIELEQSDASARRQLVSQALKELHTLKGAARAVGLPELEMLCHALETVLSALAAAGSALTPAQFDLMHQAGALAQSLVQKPSGRLRNQAAGAIKRLEALAAQMPPASADATGVPAASGGVTAEGADGTDSAETAAAAQPASALEAELPHAHEDDMIRVQSHSLDAIRHQTEALLAVELGLGHEVDALLGIVEDIVARQDALQADADSDLEHGKFNRQLEQRCRLLAGKLQRTRRNFSVARSNLMEAALETALVPIAGTLAPLPALVRNLARGQGKEATLRLEGQAVRIDRRIADIVRGALNHLVTNAVDHGIESAGQRAAAGKPPIGSVQIRVVQSGSEQVEVCVADDGAGIDVERVVAAAVQGGEIDTAQAALMDEQQRMHLALKTGISTRTAVTATSGRGVGLAIVAEKVAAIGGSLHIESAVGAGCAIHLRLPVRLATMRGVVVRTRGMPFVLPLSGIVGVHALKDDELRTVENRETILDGERVIPAIRLGGMLRLIQAPDADGDGERIAVVVQAGLESFALLVDEVVAEQEVLPRSLGKQLRRVRFVAGAAQLGDGRLVPILNLEDIARHGFGMAPRADAATPRGKARRQTQRVLVAEDSMTSRLLLKHILESAGYQIETAVDGLDALSRLRQRTFNAVISDVEMPNLDGIGLTRRIRADAATATLPVILVTSLQLPEEKQRGLEAGADAYVVKGSFDQDSLLATLRRLI